MQFRNISVGKSHVGFEAWSVPFGCWQSVWFSWDEFSKLAKLTFMIKLYSAGKWSREGFLPVERAIERKTNPSNHKCDARCLNAKGFRCECECGGKNHGAGAFICEALAA